MAEDLKPKAWIKRWDGDRPMAGRIRVDLNDKVEPWMTNCIVEPLYGLARAPVAPPEGADAIIHELQHIRIGMLDHYRAAQILEKLVGKAQGLALLPRPAPEPEGEEKPVAWVSPAQLVAHADPHPDTDGGHYLPTRKTRRGNFTQPLYAAFVSDFEHIRTTALRIMRSNKMAGDPEIAILIADELSARPSPPAVSPAEGEKPAPSGFVLAPADPSMVMLNQAVDATGAGSGMSWNGRSPQSVFEAGYRAMVAKLAPASTPAVSREEVLGLVEIVEAVADDEDYLAQAADILALISGAPPTAGGWKPDREAVAKIIEPWAFGIVANINHTERAADDRAKAFTKADAILSLPSTLEGGE